MTRIDQHAIDIGITCVCIIPAIICGILFWLFLKTYWPQIAAAFKILVALVTLSAILLIGLPVLFIAVICFVGFEWLTGKL